MLIEARCAYQRHPGSSEQTYFAGALRYSAVKYGIVSVNSAVYAYTGSTVCAPAVCAERSLYGKAVDNFRGRGPFNIKTALPEVVAWRATLHPPRTVLCRARRGLTRDAALA
eukprot:scaffold44051_cov60-Phaeocystis_antarctica.AAC.3